MAFRDLYWANFKSNRLSGVTAPMHFFLKRKIRLEVENLEDRRLLAIAPEYVTNVDYVNKDPAISGNITSARSLAYFPHDTDTTGQELWRTDGTQAGTWRISDFEPGVGGRAPIEMAAFGDKLFYNFFFQGNKELWVTDGTDVGTHQVLPLDDGHYHYQESLVPLSNALAFSDADFGIWLTDGSTSGSTMIFEGNVPINELARRLAEVGDTIFFTGRKPQSRELWKSDGTAAGAVLVKNISSATSVYGSDPIYLTNVNGTLLFAADDEVHGRELWISDGTEAGTTLVKDILPGIESSNLANFINLGGTLFFTANDGVRGTELWRSDGTAAGTYRVADITPGAGDSNLRAFTQAGGKLYFLQEDDQGGLQLWRSTGTAASTYALHDVSNDLPNAPGNLTVVGNQLFFKSADGHVWRTNGSVGGTQAVLLDDGSAVTVVTAHWGVLGGSLLFQPNNDELWKTDGTTAGTAKAVSFQPRGGFVGPTVATSQSLFFMATDADHGTELWKSDGTVTNTELVKDLTPGSSSSSIYMFAALNDVVYFVMRDPDTDAVSLWRSDGSDSGTTLLSALPGQIAAPSLFGAMMAAGQFIYFATAEKNHFQLWSSNGTAAGTRIVNEVTATNPTGYNQTYLDDFVEFNGQLYYTYHESGRHYLDKVSGAPATNTRVTAFASTVARVDLAALDNTLYLGVDNQTLLKSDGTATGISLVKALGTSTVSWNFTVVDDLLYFTQYTMYLVDGVYLWRSDGTGAGTQQVVPINPDRPIRGFGALAGKLYFEAYEETHGEELWVSDGTAAGTHLFADIASIGGSDPNDFVVLNNALYFSAADVAHGRSLYRLGASEKPRIQTISTVQYREGAVASPIARDAVISDADSTNFGGGKLTLTIAAGYSPGDELSLRTQGTGPNQIGLQGNKVTYGGTIIGALSGGLNGIPLVVAFNAAANPSNTRVLLRNIVFRSTGDNPVGGNRQLSIVLADGDGGISNQTLKNVAVIPVNDRPTLALGGSLTYRENQAARILASTITVIDPDSPTFNGGKLTVRIAENAAAEDRLEIQSQGTGSGQISVTGLQVRYQGAFIGTYAGGTGNQSLVVTLNGNATIAAVQHLVQSVTFRTLGDNPSTLMRKINFTLNDDHDAVSNLASKLVSVVALNDSPILSGGGSIGYSLNSSAILVSSTFGLSDPDSDDFALGRLLVKFDSGADATNRLEVGGLFGFAGNNLIYNGTTVVGTRNANGGTGTTDLSLTLNSQATFPIVAQLLRSIRFRTAVGTTTQQRIISFNITDGDSGASNTITRTVDVS